MEWLRIHLTIKKDKAVIFSVRRNIKNVTEYKEEIRKFKVLFNAMAEYLTTSALTMHIDRTWLVNSIELATALEMINALDIDVSRTALHYWRSGKKQPDKTNLKKIVDFLGVDNIFWEV